MGIAVPQHTQTPNDLFDEWLPDMSDTELRVTLVVIRQTLGWHKSADAISLTQFQKMTGLSRQGVISGIAAAIKRGTIKESGTGKRGVKLYAPIYDRCQTGQENRPDDKKNSKESDPTVKQTSQLSRPVDDSTSQLSRPDEALTSQLSRHTKETTTKESKDSKKKDSTPHGVTSSFSTIEERYGVGVGEDWLAAYWDMLGITPVTAPPPKKERPRNLPFEAISEHIFEIPDWTKLDDKEKKRVGKHAAIAREAFRLVIETECDTVLALAIANYTKDLIRESNGFKKPSIYPDPFKTDFKRYLFKAREAIVLRINQERNPKPVEVDDSPIIDEERQRQVHEGLAALTASKSGNRVVAA